MSIDELPMLPPPDYGHVRDPERPILSFSWSAPGAHRAAAHSHPRAHIIFPTAGACWVITPEGRWLVPSGQAIWIPPDIHHQVYAHRALSARMIFVDPTAAGTLRAASGTVQVSPLLTELTQRAMDYGNDYPPDGPAARLAQVMLDELAALKVAPLLIPISPDPRLARVMQAVIDDPARPDSLDVCARTAGASVRTLARLFAKETGMTFTQWKTRVRLVASIERLTHGATVTDVAFELGYSSTSSFVYMFRSNIGISPGRYRASDGGKAGGDRA